MSESPFSQFTDFLKAEGPVAIVIRQALAPVNEDDPIIFPPTYPLTTFKGRITTVNDGEYRVSVQLPADPKAARNEKSADQAAGYNIDRFPGGCNSCEVDSPQSQANRIEPEFKKPTYCDLVPQIKIKVGNGSANGITVNLLDAGHRAGDAVVRLSSLASEFHAAFLDIKAGNHFTLATLAPTSLVFGVWDSRSTQVKVQRVLKACIRASNVRECTRSAQFTPAADYVAAGAVDEDRDQGEGDQNPLSSEGMKHALAVQKVGGIMIMPETELTRTVNLNLAAIRALWADDRADDGPRTKALQAYILGLALLAATVDLDLNLREGCNLRFKDEKDAPKLIPRRGEAKPVALDHTEIVNFARASATEFFRIAGIPFEGKDHLDVIFEAGVAEEFLGLEKKGRDQVRALGPITAATLKQFRDKGGDPFKPLAVLIKAANGALGKPNKKGQPAVQNQEAVNPVLAFLTSLSEDASAPEDARPLASELAEYLAGNRSDSHAALKHVEAKLKAFKKSPKDAVDAGAGTSKNTPKE